MSLEDRIRNAAENILGDESLGGDLMDDEAQILLDWGLNLAERVVRSTETIDEKFAATTLDEGLYALRRTMRRVGRLVGNLSSMDSDEARERIQKVLDAADKLPAVEISAPEDLQSELEALRQMPTGQALGQVLTWINLGGDEKGDT